MFSRTRFSRTRISLAAGLLVLAALACQTANQLPQAVPATTISQPTPANLGLPTLAPIATPGSTGPTSAAGQPSAPGVQGPDEPVVITGKIPFTSPFFYTMTAEPFVMLEDEAGFVKRDRNFQFSLVEQTIGPVEMNSDNSLTYELSLPEVPQATQLNLSNDGKQDKGVQVFAIAFWSNTWGGPFLERRDGTGWSTAYTSAITDPQNNDEIKGGILMVWAPDDQQKFPTGFGSDHKLFTGDDPTAPVPAGYSIVDLNQTPFKIYKQARPRIDLNEGEVAVTDYSKMGYSQAFDALIQKIAPEYAFTQLKNINWQALHDQFAPRVAAAQNKDDFYRALRDFSWSIPDAHVDLGGDDQVFLQERGGGLGLVLAQLSDNRVIAARVLPGLPAEQAGIKAGAEIVTWANQPVADAINKVNIGPFSTDQSKHYAQVEYLARLPVGTRVAVSFKNPNESQARSVTLQAVSEFDSLLALPSYNQDPVALPVESRILSDSRLGYIRINTFNDDSNLMAHLWDRSMKFMVDNKVPGLILDIRVNPGGDGGMASNFAGYFFDKEITVNKRAYYNERTGKFEYLDFVDKITPAPMLYSGKVALLVSPDCVSACEGFAYQMTQQGRSIVVGQYPTAGGYGDVLLGQFKLPDGLTIQFPTGRSETSDGKILIEGVGVAPTVKVPVTEQSATGQEDAVLNAAIQALNR